MNTTQQSESDVKKLLEDATPTRIKAGFTDQNVVIHKPCDEIEVSNLLKQAASDGTKILVRGEASNVVGMFEGHEGDVLSTVKLGSVFEIDVISQTVRVGAGMNGGDLEKRLNQAGFTSGQFPQSLYISTVGGWYNTRATGSHSTGHGGFEFVVRGGVFVLGDGEILRFAPRARPMGGIDALSALIGSEGSLGVVTELTIDIRRQHPSQRICFLFEDFPSVIHAQRELIQGGYGPSLLRGYNEAETSHIMGYVAAEKCLLLATIEGPESIQHTRTSEVTKLLTSLGGEIAPHTSADKWFAERYQVETMMVDRNSTPGMCFDTIEVSLPWSSAADCTKKLEESIGELTSQFYMHFSHAYNSGACLYLLLWVDENGNDDRAQTQLRKTWQVASEIVSSFHGVTGHHHGIGMMRSNTYSKSADALIHKQLRNALDPSEVLHARLLDG